MKRAMTEWGLMAVVLVCGSALTFAQEPSMADTKQFLERDSLGWLSGRAKMGGYGPDLRITVTRLTLDECVLSFTEGWVEAGAEKSRTVAVPMKDLDIASIAVKPENKLMTTFVSFETRGGAGKTIVTTETGKPASSVGGAALFVIGTLEGQRVVNAIRRAAVLCGASGSAF